MASGNAAFSDDTQLISKVPPLSPLFHTSKVEGRACNGVTKFFLAIHRKYVENKCYLNVGEHKESLVKKNFFRQQVVGTNTKHDRFVSAFGI